MPQFGAEAAHPIDQARFVFTGRPSDCMEPDKLHRLFPGDSEMAQRMRALDWSATRLGPPPAWPESLRTAVSICLTSRFPIFVWWGPELTMLYNDAYIPVLGPGKHPQYLGRPARECWADIWDTIGPLTERVLREARSTWSEELLLVMDRHLPREETYFTFSYSPVLVGEEVGGVFCACTETTDYVVGRRRLDTLRELARRSAKAASLDGAAERAAEVLTENPWDVPFAAIYLVDTAQQQATLAASVRAESLFEPSIPLGGTPPARWPLARVWTQRRSEDLLEPEGFASSGGGWPEQPQTAVLLPVVVPGLESSGAVLVAGVNPRRPLDAAYRDFFASLATQIGAALAEASAYETERRRAESLAEIDRAKTAFFSNVSHEFRTPLTLMLGPLDDLLASAQLPQAERQTLELAQRNGLRLLRLVNTLLDFSRIEAGRAEASFEPVDACELTKDLASVFRSAIARAGLRFEVECREISRPVYLDREMWEKIVLNLLSNAFKFTLEGSIHIDLGEEDGMLRLRVADTGIGIPAEELPKIFERFHRVRGSAGRTHEGSGIGLALVHELVRLHGGRVDVASSPGHGTTFDVHLPFGSAHLPPERVGAGRKLPSTAIGAAPFVEEALRWLPDPSPDELPVDEAGLASRESGSGRIATLGARVLVADDNADMRSYIEKLLRPFWQVQSVADGRSALAAIRRGAPDLVLSDVMMPQLDGIGLLQAIREDPSLRGLPVILLSARAGEESRVEGLAAGADDYLTKPFSARELLARVSGHLEMAQLRRQAAVEREELRARETAARREAEKANRAKDEFLAVLSHELRSPMNAMLGWLRILKAAGPRDPELVRRAADTIERNIDVQAQVVNDLLDVSRIISGKLQLESERVDVASVVSSCVESMRPAAAGKHITLQLDLEGRDIEVIGDAARLQQVMANLLTNALKFTESGGSIRVRCEAADGSVLVRVSDTGHGIDPEFLPHIFERFRQADSTTARKYGGLGLGLAIVKNVVELHGGRVEASSEGVGRGSTFSLLLPRAEPEARVRTRPVAVLPRQDRERHRAMDILLVEDERDSREALELALGEQGARVRSVASVREAIEAYERRAPDLLISDIGMPDGDGYRLIREIREREEGRAHRTMAIAITGFAARQDREMALRAGFDEHVGKPVEPELLFERLRVLDASRDETRHRRGESTQAPAE